MRRGFELLECHLVCFRVGVLCCYMLTYVQDGCSKFLELSEKCWLYWVSFLDGTQRVLLFTDDLAITLMAQQVSEHEQQCADVV